MNSSTGHVTTAFLDFAVCNQATAHNTFERIDEKMTSIGLNAYHFPATMSHV